MKLTYQLTQNDIVEAFLFHVANYEKTRSRNRTSHYFVTFGFLFFSAMAYDRDSVSGFVVLGVLGLLWFFFWPSYLQRAYKKGCQRRVRENFGDSSSQHMSYELKDDGIHTITPVGNSNSPYSVVNRIVVNDIYTYVYIGKTVGVILPNDRIPKEQIDAFVAELQKRIDSAKGSSNGSTPLDVS